MIDQYLLLQKILRDDNSKDKFPVLYNLKLSLSFRHAHTQVIKNNVFDLKRKDKHKLLESMCSYTLMSFLKEINKGI